MRKQEQGSTLRRCTVCHIAGQPLRGDVLIAVLATGVLVLTSLQVYNYYRWWDCIPYQNKVYWYYALQALIVFYQFFKTLYSLLELCGIEVSLYLISTLICLCGDPEAATATKMSHCARHIAETRGHIAATRAATATKTHPEREPLIPECTEQDIYGEDV